MSRINKHQNKDIIIPISTHTNVKHRLTSITENSYTKIKANIDRPNPKIQRVSPFLRKSKNRDQVFSPEVVALGPFHVATSKLARMEDFKKAATRQFVADSIETFYEKVRNVADEARECYEDLGDLKDEEFVDMMLFDGCFVLWFVESVLGITKDTLQVCTHLQGFIIKDMFLLENQIPYVVLEALMSLKYVDLQKFVDVIIIRAQTSTNIGKSRNETTEKVLVFSNPCHLLDLLRTRILGPPEANSHKGAANWTTFRSVTELYEAGIKFEMSATRTLRDVDLQKRNIHSYLSLPQIVVDDLTNSSFLNLIALEMCPDNMSTDYGITSYVWLMDRLIDRPEDVKHLRDNGVLLNLLGNDEQVADLFNELATDLSPEPHAYYDIIQGIDKHYNNKCLVRIVNFVNTHFNTPWAGIAFFVAGFVTILTLVQTIFTVWPRG